MARVKISEYRAKKILYAALGSTYNGVSLDSSKDPFVKTLGAKLVVKVDQAVKKRNKQGLVYLNVSPEDVSKKIEDFEAKGYKWALVESFIPHDTGLERFIAFERTEKGIDITYSEYGGVDIEENTESIKKVSSVEPYAKNTSTITILSPEILTKLINSFEENHFTYLEINPFLLVDKQLVILDAAVEVDTAAEFFVGGRWSSNDFRFPGTTHNEVEQAVEELASKSPASLNLKVLNQDGSIFLLLSGGGASVVVADEFSNLGHRKEIANYGEYSGNPSEEETYLYTKQVLKLLLASKAPQKVLLIAGGVANFTDVGQTFKGIIRALKDDITQLAAQKVSVLVRRGGPNQAVGLAAIEGFLNEVGLTNEVHGPEVSLSEIVMRATEEL